MSTQTNFKDIVDLPDWRPLAFAPNASAAGTCLICDYRNSEDRHPLIYELVSATVLNQYSVKGDGWSFVGSPALAGTFGIGAAGVMMPSRGPRGTLAAGATTTKIVLSTALPASVGVNQLAGRGDGVQGFRIRIIGSSSGGSGKTEERLIVANTAGTQPTIYLDSALTFTPASGDSYEILSGRVYLLSAGTTAAGVWKYYDIATNSFSGNLSTTNLAATIGTDTSIVGLDESYVPHNKDPYGGFLGQITATASAATTITGSVAGADSALLANEYRNFQIRIVQDTSTPTAVGQRRKITSHTAGASPVYTVPTWTVTPSSSAVFVIENSNEILLWTNAVTTTYTYAQDIIGAMTADTWSTSTYAVRPAAMGAGCMSFQSFGISPSTTNDPDKLARHSHVYSFRGAATTTLHLLDLAGAATGSWSTETYASIGTTFTTGSSITYDPWTQGGRYAYISVNGTQNFMRFNAYTRNINEWAYLRFAQSTATVGGKMAATVFIDADDETKIAFVITKRQTGQELFQTLISR